jgi:hypothetical protein
MPQRQQNGTRLPVYICLGPPDTCFVFSSHQELPLSLIQQWFPCIDHCAHLVYNRQDMPLCLFAGAFCCATWLSAGHLAKTCSLNPLLLQSLQEIRVHMDVCNFQDIASIPGTPPLPRPLQHLQVTSKRCFPACQFIPRAAVLMCPLKHIQPPCF